MMSGLWSRLKATPLRRMVRGRQADFVRQQAEAARDQGRWREAADLFDTHTGMRPRRVGSWIQLGNMRKQAGEHAAAERAYRHAITIRPTAEAWSQLGHLLLTQGRNGDAIDALQAALELVPSNRVAREGLISAGVRGLLQLGGGGPSTFNRLRDVSTEIDKAIAAAIDASITPLAFYDQVLPRRSGSRAARHAVSFGPRPDRWARRFSRSIAVQFTLPDRPDDDQMDGCGHSRRSFGLASRRFHGLDRSPYSII